MLWPQPQPNRRRHDAVTTCGKQGRGKGEEGSRLPTIRVRPATGRRRSPCRILSPEWKPRKEVEALPDLVVAAGRRGALRDAVEVLSWEETEALSDLIVPLSTGCCRTALHRLPQDLVVAEEGSRGGSTTPAVALPSLLTAASEGHTEEGWEG
jgi:hypothetical protein